MVVEVVVEPEMSVRLKDSDNRTCVALADTDRYTFLANSGVWFPHPKNACWLSGLVIKRCVPDAIKTSFTLTITGHHLTCSTSHFKVQMQQQSKPSACHLAGKYRTCKWSGAADETGALTTCVAECQCQGDDCKQLVVHIPKLYEDWKICEINIK